MFVVYIIFSPKYERYYVGLSSNIQTRLDYHNSGHVKSTKSFVPWQIVYQENFRTRVEARKREKYLKSAAGRRWRKVNLGH